MINKKAVEHCATWINPIIIPWGESPEAWKGKYDIYSIQICGVTYLLLREKRGTKEFAEVHRDRCMQLESWGTCPSMGGVCSNSYFAGTSTGGGNMETWLVLEDVKGDWKGTVFESKVTKKLAKAKGARR